MGPGGIICAYPPPGEPGVECPPEEEEEEEGEGGGEEGEGGDDETTDEEKDESQDSEEEDSGAPGELEGGSVIDNTALRFRHHAVDYNTPTPTGCVSCGSVHPGPKTLPTLKIIRGHNYDQTIVSTLFGKHVGWNWDIWLRFGNQFDNAQVLQATRTQHRVQMRDVGVGGASDGVFRCEDWDVYDRLETYDSLQIKTADRANTVSAKLFRHDGAVLEFEVFSLMTAGGGTRYGRLTSFTDRNGNRILFTWEHDLDDPQLTDATRDRLFRRDQAIDAYNRTFTFHYQSSQVDGFWVCSRIDLPNGEHIEYRYGTVGPDGEGGSNIGLTSVLHPDGIQSTFNSSFDPVSQCVQLFIFDAAAQDPLSRIKTVFLSSVAAVDGDGHVVNQAGNRIRMMLNGDDEVSYLVWQGSVNGESVNFVYSGAGKISALVLDQKERIIKRYIKDTFNPDGSDLGQTPGNWSEWSLVDSGIVYDDNSRLVEKTNGAGKAYVRQRHPRTGRTTQITHVDGSVSSATYNEFKQPLTHVDRLMRETRWGYDGNGNLMSKTEAFGTLEEGTWRFTYNGLGQCETRTDANNNVTEYFYSTSGDPNQIDGSGYLVKIIEPADIPGGPRAESLFYYDSAGRLDQTKDPLGRTTVYEYDKRNRLVKTIFPDLSTEIITYAGPERNGGFEANLVVATTDRNGNETEYFYDFSGRVDVMVQAFGSSVPLSTFYGYLDGSKYPDVITRGGVTSIYNYDTRARKTGESTNVNGAITLTSSKEYDNANRVDFQTDAYGRRTFYVYDDNSRIKRKVFEMASGELSPPDPTSYTNPLAYLADRDNYLLGLVRTPDGIAGANAGYLIEDITYDAEGQFDLLIDPRGFTTDYSYDAQGRQTTVVEAVSTPDEAKVEYDYDPQGNLVEIRTPRYFVADDTQGFDNARAVMTYTGRNLLETKTVAPGTPEAATESHTYFLDRRADSTTDPRGNTLSRLWGTCCARLMAVVDPPSYVDDSSILKRSADVVRHDFYGNITHTGRVVNVDNVAFANTPENPTVFTDLPDVETLSETTYRYDARHRRAAKTIWLVPRGPIDPDSVPIAGGAQQSDPPVVDDTTGQVLGLTTTWEYDDDLADGVGLDAAYASEINAQLPNGFYGSSSDGYAVAITNPEGEVSTAFMDGLGRIVLTVDASGDTQRFEYDSTTFVSGSGLLLESSMTDALGQVVINRHDGAGRLIQSVDSEGRVNFYSYDNNSNVVSFRDPAGVGEDCIFDARNRQTECRDTQEIVDLTFRETVYDANSNVVAMVDAAGNSSTYAYDARDRQVSYTDRINALTQYFYDANSNLMSIEDAEGGVTKYEYDPRNLQIAVEYPGHTPEFGTLEGDYNNDGIVSQGDLNLVLLNWGATTLPAEFYEPSLPGGAFDGQIGQNELDAVLPNFGNTIQSDRSGYDRIDVAYDALHRPAKRLDQLGDNSTYSYDLASRLTRVDYRLASATSVGLGGPLAYVSFAGSPSDVTGNGYDAQVLDFNAGVAPPAYTAGPDGAPNQALAFSGADNQVCFIQTMPDTISSVSFGLWARSMQPNWNQTDVLAGRDGAWKISPQQGTKNIVLEVTQDNAQNLQVQFQPGVGFDITQWHYYLATYDETTGKLCLYVDGQLEVQTDYTPRSLATSSSEVRIGSTLGFPGRSINGKVSGFVVFDRAIDADEAEALASAGASATGDLKPPTDSNHFTYDKASRLLTAESERYGNTITYEWTDDSLILSEKIQGNVSTDPAGYTIGRDYDAEDRLKTITYPDGSVVTRTYTSRNQLDTLIRDPDGAGPTPEVQLMDMDYNSAMRETVRLLGNGLQRQAIYDRADHLPTALTVETAPGNADRPGLSWSTYGYDLNKNLDVATTGGNMADYSYTAQQDAENRLDLWTRANGEREDYGLSLVGDWDTYDSEELVNGILTTTGDTRTHNGVHEITDIDSGGGAIPLRYDAKGNLLEDEPGRTYQWDFDNRLVEVRNSAGHLLGSYTYDALGRRVTKTVPGDIPDDPSVTTAYVCMADDSGMSQQIAEYEAGVLRRQYIYGDYIDEPISLIEHDASFPDGEQVLYLHRDRQFNIVGLSDDAGVVVERYAYSPFGKRRILAPDGITVRQTSAFSNPLGHQGIYHDDKTELLYNRSRYRNPDLGQWLSRDTLGYEDGYSLYANYQNINDGLDPSGNIWRWWWDDARWVFKRGPKRSTGKNVKRRSTTEMELHKEHNMGDDVVDIMLRAGAGDSLGEFLDGLVDVTGEIAKATVTEAITSALGLGTFKFGGKLFKVVCIKGKKVLQQLDEAGNVTKTFTENETRKWVERNADKLPRGFCFVAGTLVAVNEGRVPIESIQVGDRVLTTDESEGPGASEVDPETWKKITLRMPNPTHPNDVLEITVLRSPEWMLHTGCELGARIYFTLEEMGLEGWAKVTIIEPCPKIQEGAGRVVLATVNHNNGNVFTLHLIDGTVLEPTGRHRLFSENQQDWIPTEQLIAGDLLRTRGGSAAILSIERKPGIHRVFNIEVETEHCYWVSVADVLSHNSNPCAAGVKQRLAQLPRGKRSHVRTVSDEKSLNDLYNELTEGAEILDSGKYPGELRKLADGTTIGKRAGSKSGGATIDIKLPDGSTLKVHIE